MSILACLKSKNLNDPAYLKWCLGALCISPGWCYIQYAIMKKLKIRDEVATKSPKGFVPGCAAKPCAITFSANCTKCAILLLWTCDQSFLFRIYQNQKERYPLDVCLFLFSGFCIMPQDIELAFPGHPKDGTPYASTRLSCLNPDYCCKFSNCLVSLSLCCMPIPSTV